MKIVRHVAPDMRQAMRAIRERLGEDAVILSSRRIAEGVEVTAAVDFDAVNLTAHSALAAAETAPQQKNVTPARSEIPTFRNDSREVRDELLLIRADVQAAALGAAEVRKETMVSRIEALAIRSEPQQPPPPVVEVVTVPPICALAPPVSIVPMAVNPISTPEPAQPADADDLVALAHEPPEASQPDTVGIELKALRRMLETQLAQLAWNDMSRRAPIHTETLRELTEIGITHELATHITEQLPRDVDLTYARRFAIAALSQYLNVTGDRWLENGGRIAFIGATGVGKTTTLAKLAVRWVLRHGPRDLALVAADGTRLGAQDQMQSLGQLLGAPVYTPENFETLPALLGRLQQRFILIDTPGSSLRDTQLAARMSVLANSASQLQTALVLAASTQAGALDEAVKRFAPANPCCCVLTKVDEAASLGGALSILIRARVPISYVSEGQRIPEDLRPARALELVSTAVRLAKTSGAAADEDLLRRRFGKVAHAIT